MKIEFVDDPIGRPYRKGDVKEFVGPVEEGYAKKYIDRGWAKEVEAKAKEKAEKAEADRIASEAAAAEAKRIADLSAVQIPHNWAELGWPELRSLASSVTDEPVKSKDDAVKAVELELKRRVAAAAA